MITEWFQVLPTDTMESLTERALKVARETGIAQRFVFDRKIFEACPAPEGYGSVQMLYEDRPRGSRREEAVANILTASKAIAMEWTSETLAKEAIEFPNRKCPFWITPSEPYTYGGISRGPQTAEERLAVIRDVLLEHLRFQMQQAPSSGALYANDVKPITASDIARVVQALEGEPTPQFMPQQWGQAVQWTEGTDFAAESQDGSKIVIENRFQSGVIFDPANRPIRKFRLKEESAA